MQLVPQFRDQKVPEMEFHEINNYQIFGNISCYPLVKTCIKYLFNIFIQNNKFTTNFHTRSTVNRAYFLE